MLPFVSFLFLRSILKKNAVARLRPPSCRPRLRARHTKRSRSGERGGEREGRRMVYWFHEFRRFSGRMDIVCAVQVASRRRGIHSDMQMCVCAERDVDVAIDIERRFKPLISPKYLSLQRNAITFRVPIPTDTPCFNPFCASRYVIDAYPTIYQREDGTSMKG